jgi:hypothetical protein
MFSVRRFFFILRYLQSRQCHILVRRDRISLAAAAARRANSIAGGMLRQFC